MLVCFSSGLIYLYWIIPFPSCLDYGEVMLHASLILLDRGLYFYQRFRVEAFFFATSRLAVSFLSLLLLLFLWIVETRVFVSGDELG